MGDVINSLLEEATKGNVELYHGSLGLYDTLEPFSLNYGNAIEKPGWSIYCFKEKNFAFLWCIHMTLQNIAEELKLPREEAILNPQDSKVLIHKENKDAFYERVKKKKYKFYVYTVNVPTSVVGFGHDSRYDEFTIRIKHVVPTQIDTVTLNDKILDKWVKCVDDETHKQMKESEFLNGNSLLRSLLMTKDYWIEGNVNRKAMDLLRADYKSGKLKAGDDLEEYLAKKKMSFKKISIDQRMKEIIKDPSIVTNALLKECSCDIDMPKYYSISPFNKDDELITTTKLYTSIDTALDDMKSNLKHDVYYVHVPDGHNILDYLKNDMGDIVEVVPNSINLKVFAKIRVFKKDDGNIGWDWITIYHEDGTVTNSTDEFYRELKKELQENTVLAEEYILHENSVLIPVFIISVFTGTLFGKAIKSYLHSTYSHSAIGLTPELDYLYSFNAKGLNGEPGISVESVEGYTKENPQADICVSAFFVKQKEFDLLKSKMDWFVQHANQTSYDFKNIIRVMFNKAKEAGENTSMMCSQFVDSMMKMVNMDITNKPSNLVTPDDLVIKRSKKGKIYKLFEGTIIDYNSGVIRNKIQLLKNRTLNESTLDLIYPLLEAKEFPIQFNPEGDLLIKNPKKVDLREEYYKSVKLLKVYKKDNNIEGIKYELDRLWFIYTMLDTEELGVLRGTVYNTITQYVSIVQRIDPIYNVSQHFETSPFNNDKTIIKKSTIHHSANLLKKIFK